MLLYPPEDVSLSVCLSVCLSLMSLCLSAFSLCVCLFVDVPVCLSIYLFAYASVCLAALSMTACLALPCLSANQRGWRVRAGRRDRQGGADADGHRRGEKALRPSLFGHEGRQGKYSMNNKLLLIVYWD